MKKKKSYFIIGILLRNFSLKTQNNYLFFTLFFSVCSSFLYSQEKNISLDSIAFVNNNNITNLSLETALPVLYIANANAIYVLNNSLHVPVGNTIIVNNIPIEKKTETIASIFTTIKPKNIAKPTAKQEKIIKQKAIVKSFPLRNNPFAPHNIFGNSKAIVSSVTVQSNNKLVKAPSLFVYHLLQYHKLDISLTFHKDINLLLEDKTNTPLSRFSLAIIARPPPFFIG